MQNVPYLQGNSLFLTIGSSTIDFKNSVYRTGSLLPSVVSKLDDVLLVKELNAKYFDHSISENLLHAAVTSPAATAEFDYERLELLGACFSHYCMRS